MRSLRITPQLLLSPTQPPNKHKHTQQNTTRRHVQQKNTHTIYTSWRMYIIRGTPFLPPFLSPPYYCWWRWGIRRWLGDAYLMDGWIYADQSATGIYTCATQHIILCYGRQEESPLPFDLTASLTSFIVFVVTHHSFLNWSGWEMEEALPRGPSPASQYYLDEAPPASLTPTTSHNNIFNVISL